MELPKINFWKRLELFVKEVQVDDMPSEEEKEMILATCKRHLTETDSGSTQSLEKQRGDLILKYISEVVELRNENKALKNIFKDMVIRPPLNSIDADVKKLATDHYGNDMNMYAQQRDGFVVGFEKCMSMSQDNAIKFKNWHDNNFYRHHVSGLLYRIDNNVISNAQSTEEIYKLFKQTKQKI